MKNTKQIIFQGVEIPECNLKRFSPDSLYIPDFCKKHLEMDSTTIFQSLMDVQFAPRDHRGMFYRGNPLNRTKLFAVDDLKAQVPIYTYTGFQYESLQFYQELKDIPAVKDLVENFNTKIHVVDGSEKSISYPEINHVIGTLYQDEEDYIGYHHDKDKTFAKDSFVYILSLGGIREFHLKEVQSGIVTPLVLTPGSLFVLGPKTNQLFQHCIPPSKDNLLLQETKVNPRISLCLRHIINRISRVDLDRRIQQSLAMKSKKKRSRENDNEPSKRRRKVA